MWSSPQARPFYAIEALLLLNFPSPLSSLLVAVARGCALPPIGLHEYRKRHRRLNSFRAPRDSRRLEPLCEMENAR